MRGVATIAITLIIAACGGGPPTPTGQPTQSTQATSSSPTAVSTPTATPTAAPTLAVEQRRLSETVSRGDRARVSVTTTPGAECTIVVEYPSGPSTAAGLEPQTVSDTGVATWRWRVGRNIPTGTHPITVTCTANGTVGTLELEFTVR